MSEIQLDGATSTADAVVARTLTSCADEMALTPEGVIERLRHGDQMLQELWYCTLAQQIVEQLGRYDGSIKAGYLSEPVSSQTTPANSTVHLIIWAAKTAALHSLIEALNQALARHLAELLGAEQSRPLHIEVVDDADVHNPAGYHLLLFTPPNLPIRLSPGQ